VQPTDWNPDPATYRRTASVLRPLQRLHRQHVSGFEHVPPTGRVLLVMHHSFATYDAFLFGLALVEFTGRIPRGLGDDRLFQTPGVRRIMRTIGIVPASPGAGRALLENGELVGVAPGGMWEALRPRSERYQTRWGDRRGFVRLALRTGTPLMLVACRTADDLYTVYDNPVTDAIYKRFHIPIPLVRGWGPTLIPRPVQLTHHIAPPIVPPPWQPDREEEQLEAVFAEASATMDRLLHRADPGIPVWNGPPGGFDAEAHAAARQAHP